MVGIRKRHGGAGRLEARVRPPAKKVAPLQPVAPARQVGIRPGDVLTRWNDQPVDDPIQFSRLVAEAPIGAQALVTVIRDGREVQLPVVVGERPH